MMINLSISEQINTFFDQFEMNNIELINKHFLQKYPGSYYGRTPYSFYFPGGLRDQNRYDKEVNNYILSIIKDNIFH